MYRKLSEIFPGTAITALILAGYAACLYSLVTGAV